MRDGRCWSTGRRPGRWYPDVWDPPGGHVEPGAAPQRALEHELGEELGNGASVTGERFARVWGDNFRMDVWVLDRRSAEPTNQDLHEHDVLARLTGQEMGALRLADRRLPHLVRSALGLPGSTPTTPVG